MKISDLGLSRRAVNCLYRAGIKTVEELREKHEWELQCIRSFGNKSLREVKDALDRIENMTNGDRIRAMKDEELAEFLCSHMAHCDPKYCPGEHLCGCEEGKASGLKLWLSQPAREG